MLTLEEAVQCAERELRQDSALLGHEIVPGPGHETPGFWVFYPNRPNAFASPRSTESLSYRIPPLVVNRATGFVTRPVAAGSPVRAVDLGPDQWFIVPPPDHPPKHVTLDGLDLADTDLLAIAQLRHFRVRRAGRDSGDTLEAGFVAVSPDAIGPGLTSAGFIPGALHRWSLGGPEEFAGSVQSDSATVDLRMSGNGYTDNPWTIGSGDIRLAERIEVALEDASWIRFWR
jgi:hypothetical protein